MTTTTIKQQQCQKNNNKTNSNEKNRNSWVCYVNEVVHDTFDTAAAVTTEFDPEETDDKSANVDVALCAMRHSTTDGIALDEFSLTVVPTNDPYLADLEDNAEIDLEKFEMMETSAFS